MTRVRLAAMLALLLICSANATHAAARRTEKSINPSNTRLLELAPAERVADLAKAVGHWCIGTEAFLMGVVTEGRAAGNAYWSVRCADGAAWAVQIDPLGEYTAIQCSTFDAAGAGKECFKKF